MSKNILRRHAKKGFTQVYNSIIDDKQLSFRAKGVALVLLSKPDDWVVRIEYLVSMGTEGRDAVRKCLHELATLGYLKRIREVDGAGNITTVTLISDYRAFEEDGTPESRINGYDSPRPTENQEVGRPTENPKVGKPEGRKTRRSENQEVFTNTDYTNTQYTNKDQTTHWECVVGNSQGVGVKKIDESLGSPQAKTTGGFVGAAQEEHKSNDRLLVTWQDTFGELTDKQRPFIHNQVRAHGADVFGEALRRAAANVAGGTKVYAPAKYVKGILDEMVANSDYSAPAADARNQRAGDIDTPEHRSRYLTAYLDAINNTNTGAQI